MDDEVFTLEEAAAFLKATEYSIREAAKTGKIPAKKIGGQWRFTKKTIMEWLETSLT